MSSGDAGFTFDVATLLDVSYASGIVGIASAAPALWNRFVYTFSSVCNALLGYRMPHDFLVTSSNITVPLIIEDLKVPYACYGGKL